MSSGKPHPLLFDPKLFISNLPGDVSDAQLARILSDCHPVKVEIERTGPSAGNKLGSGVILFDSLAKAEKALAILPDSPTISCTNTLISPEPSFTSCSIPSAFPRIIYPFLPDTSIPAPPTAGLVHDICREFGPLNSVRVWHEAVIPHSVDGCSPAIGGWRASVEFWDESDARRWETEWGQRLVSGWAVSIHMMHTYTHSLASLPPMPEPTSPIFFSQSSSPPSSYLWDYPAYVSHSALPASPWLATRANKGSNQHLKPALADSLSGPGFVDLKNLYVKNIDTDVDVQQLQAIFSPYGDIVSAQIIRNGTTGVSRGYGFVSYHTQEEANAALQAMDGRQLGRLKLQIQFHHVRSPRRSRTSETSPPLPARRTSIQQAMDAGIEGPLESAVASMTLESEPLQPSERERLHAAIVLFEPSRAEALTELIMTLSERERALCLFSFASLQRKVKEAKRVLNAAEADRSLGLSELSLREASPRTLDELAALPLARIHSVLAADPSLFGLTPPSDESISCARGWIAELGRVGEAARKQRVGEKVFALLKRERVAKAAQLTVRLLDGEDWESLCHLSMCHPDVLVHASRTVAVRLGPSH